MTISKSYTIDAAHYIKGHKKCGSIHGHTWTITVYLSGTVDPHTGMLLDFGILNKYVRPLLKKFDHKTLNEVLKFCYEEPYTAETFAEYLASKLRDSNLRKYRTLQTISVSVQEGNGGTANSDYIYFKRKAR